VAEGTAHFAGEFVFDRFRGGVVPFQAVVALGEVDVFFVEYGGPLEWSGYAMLGEN